MQSHDLSVSSKGGQSIDEAGTVKPIGKHFSRMATNAPSVSKVSKEKKGEAEEERQSWAKDELKVGGKDKKKAIKGIYKNKIEDLTLRRSRFDERALVFYFQYPKETVDYYRSLNKSIVKLPHEKSEEFARLINNDGNSVGINLMIPDKEMLIKLGPHMYLKNYSVPFAKVGKSYHTIKNIMKENGFILTQSSKYNFCWGFSKHRKEVYVRNTYS